MASTQVLRRSPIKRKSLNYGLSPVKKQKTNEEGSISVKTFYNKPKAYLSPLERKQLNDIRSIVYNTNQKNNKNVPQVSPKQPKVTPKKNVPKSASKPTSIQKENKHARTKVNLLEIEKSLVEQSPKQVGKAQSLDVQSCSFASASLFADVLNEPIQRISPLPESDVESGFAEDSSSNAMDSPVRKFLESTESKLLSPVVKRSLNSTKSTNVTSPKAQPKKNKVVLEQLMIDAGQKDFGAVRCQTCNMVFTTHDPHDELYHSKFHNKFINTLRFPGWKKEDVVADFFDGRIVRVLPKSAKHQTQKCEEVRQLIDTDLGFPNVGLVNPRETHFYLFISAEEKKIIGCSIAESISTAYKVVADPQAKDSLWCRDKTKVPAACGISRIWVLPNARRAKVASRLLNAITQNFAYGSVIEKSQVAFSDPTPDGREFISKYMTTSSFLVYGGFDNDDNTKKDFDF